MAGRTIKLVRPVEPDRLLDRPEVHARNEAEDYMPYWAYLWPGALLLLGEAARPPRRIGRAGTRALEIGCGLGLSGLVAVSLGLNVCFTDHDRTAFDYIEASARANGFDPSSYSTALLDWRDPPAERYPLILGADVTYERRLVPLVAGVVAAMLEPGGLALITDPNRVAASGFDWALSSLGLTVEAVSAATSSDEFGQVQGTIYRIRHAKTNPNLKDDSIEACR